MAKIDNADIEIELMKAISVLEMKRREFINGHFPELQMTGGEFRIILFVDFLPGTNQRQLAEKLHINNSSIARQVRKLEDNNLLYRQRCEEDRRNYMLFLTDKGKEIAPEIRRLNREWNKITTDDIPQDTVRETINTLTKMMENIPN